MSVITFLTDFGLEDDFVGTCHGVIARIAPETRVIDVTHGIGPQAVLSGALVLRSTTPFMPVGVHLAVVDPDVGGNRRAVAVPDQRRAHLRRPRQRPPDARRRRPRDCRCTRVDRGAIPPARGLPHLPRARPVRTGGRVPRNRDGARGARPGARSDDAHPNRRSGAAGRSNADLRHRAGRRPLRQRRHERAS